MKRAALLGTPVEQTTWAAPMFGVILKNLPICDGFQDFI
jgi:hypothetical protein